MLIISVIKFVIRKRNLQSCRLMHTRLSIRAIFEMRSELLKTMGSISLERMKIARSKCPKTLHTLFSWTHTIVKQNKKNFCFLTVVNSVNFFCLFYLYIFLFLTLAVLPFPLSTMPYLLETRTLTVKHTSFYSLRRCLRVCVLCVCVSIHNLLKVVNLGVLVF